MTDRMPFVPLLGSLIHSTIWREPDHVRILWITMLSLSDADGYVGASVPGLADAARLTIDKCRDGLSVLMSPDPDSRDKAENGQRVFLADGGWTIPAVPRVRQKVHDAGNAARCRRYRERHVNDTADISDTV